VTVLVKYSVTISKNIRRSESLTVTKPPKGREAAQQDTYLERGPLPVPNLTPPVAWQKLPPNTSGLGRQDAPAARVARGMAFDTGPLGLADSPLAKYCCSAASASSRVVWAPRGWYGVDKHQGALFSSSAGAAPFRPRSDLGKEPERGAVVAMMQPDADAQFVDAIAKAVTGLVVAVRQGDALNQLLAAVTGRRDA